MSPLTQHLWKQFVFPLMSLKSELWEENSERKWQAMGCCDVTNVIEALMVYPSLIMGWCFPPPSYTRLLYLNKVTINQWMNIEYIQRDSILKDERKTFELNSNWFWYKVNTLTEEYIFRLIKLTWQRPASSIFYTLAYWSYFDVWEIFLSITPLAF